ncbi:hypothetical protein [Marinobacter sp.]|uniref:hypothetical protein n=1 Tax=Marinobacter sp. TaxID=50741 RepID=UPI002B26FA23|nr:hypothetical protein [Marinobacter sp.]
MTRTLLPLLAAASLTACQSLPSVHPDIGDNAVLISAQHCLEETVGDNNRVHYGPCLKITEINGNKPNVRTDGFIELTIGQPAKIETACVYRLADGRPIPATVETATFQVRADTFPNGGRRWYLHAQKQARGVIGCQPTLAPSVYPLEKTD